MSTRLTYFPCTKVSNSNTYRPAGAIPLGSFAFETPTAEELARRANLD
jgi:hypothetical protein